ncbi:hypothetical protein V7S43_002752 [Phytophthora oleae]|uniref:RING-type domain-containing protein n=1 Tax=Phytophthora oleae TaxID=2107226 RepID=A0ABD3FZ73_9STRA
MPADEADESAVEMSEGSAEGRHWGLHVGDIAQIAQGRSEKYTYAIYCGRGRVIHVWSPSRRSFRVRVDSLRGLKASGYAATKCSRELDNFFHDLLNVTPMNSNEVIRRAKAALHSTAASRQSSLSFILFARYGDTIFTLLELLKDAYWIAVDGWMLGNEHPESLHVNDASPLELPICATRRSGNNRVAGPAISKFFGTVADLLISEWLGKSLGDFFKDSRIPNKWYPIPVPSSILCLAPLLLQYDIQQTAFQLRCIVSPTIPERMAGDRMECGVCWMDFTPLKVMLLKCQHYICDPCLRMLPKRECPYCRGSIQFAQPVGAFVKREALRLLMEAMQLEDKSPS